VCVDLIGASEEELENNSTQTYILSVLDKLCSAFPNAFGPSCEAIVNAGLPTVIDWIQLHENATIVCAQLHMCKADEARAPNPAPAVAAGNDLECQACGAAIQFVEHWLGQNQTEAWIVHELDDTVCKFIPYIQSTCDAIAASGVPKLISWIEAHENPTVVCQQLKVCPSNAAMLLRLPAVAA